MPPKIVMRKVQQIDHGSIQQNLPQLRSVYKLEGKSAMCQALYEYVKSRSYNYETRTVNCDDEPCPPTEVGVPFPIEINIKEKDGVRDFPETLEPSLLVFLKYLKLTKDIDLNEVEKVSIKIYPPAKKVSPYLNEIPFSKMRTSHRFLIPIGSDENISYKMMNMEAMSAIISSNIPQGGYEIPEAIERWKIYHFDRMTAVSLQMKFNDEDNYRKYAKFSRQGGKIERKLPLNRHMMVVDFRSTTSVTKQSFVKYVNKLKDMSEEKGKRGEQGRLALKNLSESLADEGVDIVDMISNPEDVKKESMKTFEKLKEDVEDIFIPNSEPTQDNPLDSTDEQQYINVPRVQESEQVSQISDGLKSLF